MNLEKEFVFAYRMIKENVSLYGIFKCYMTQKNRFILPLSNREKFISCLESTLYQITPYSIMTMYHRLSVPKQVMPMIGKLFNVKVFNLRRTKGEEKAQSITMECTGYDSHRNMLLFGKSGQPISSHRLSLADGENLNITDFMASLLRVKPEDYVIEKNLKLHYLCEKYPHIFFNRGRQ